MLAGIGACRAIARAMVLASSPSPEEEGLGTETVMIDMGEGEDCPFQFTFDPVTFKVGDIVSYRVTDSLEGFPFVGTALEVHDDHVLISPGENEPDARYRGTREDRPVVDAPEL